MTVWEHEEQSTGAIHSTKMQVGFGRDFGWTLGNVDMNLVTNLRACRSEALAFFGGGGSGSVVTGELHRGLGGVTGITHSKPL